MAVLRLAAAALLAVAALVAVAAAQADNFTIAEFLASDERFTTLVTLLQENNLLAELNTTEAEFTVFAPTNEVLEQLDFNATEYNATQILLYHIVPGKFNRDNFSDVTPPGNGLPLRTAPPPTEAPTTVPPTTAPPPESQARRHARQADSSSDAETDEGEAAVNFVGNLSSVTLATLLELESLDNLAQRVKVLGNVDDSVVQVNNVSVVEADIETANGFVDIVDGVLLPPGNVTAVVDELPRNFSLWDDLLERLGLADIVTEDNSTVFLPVTFSFVSPPAQNETEPDSNTTETQTDENDAQQAILEFFDSFNDSQWRDILEATVVTNEVLYLADLAEQLEAINVTDSEERTLTLTTALGTELNISIATGGQAYELTDENGRTALIARNPRLFDIPTRTGVLHVIDKPLVPESVLISSPLPAFLVGIGAQDFARALNSTGLLANVTEGNFTIFVPTDAAWESLNSTASEKDIVEVHIVEGTPELMDGTELTPLDESVTLLINHDEFAFTVRVLEDNTFGFITDHFSLPGFEIYVIDHALAPPAEPAPTE